MGGWRKGRKQRTGFFGWIPDGHGTHIWFRPSGGSDIALYDTTTHSYYYQIHIRFILMFKLHQSLVSANPANPVIWTWEAVKMV